MSDSDTAVHGCLETTGDGPNYAVLYGDELARAGDAYGFDDDSMVECQIRNDENTRILVSVSPDGIRGVTVHPADDPEDETRYEPGNDQSDRGTRWTPEDGDRPAVKIVPETEVEA